VWKVIGGFFFQVDSGKIHSKIYFGDVLSVLGNRPFVFTVTFFLGKKSNQYR
jgi:hypothetical protein